MRTQPEAIVQARSLDELLDQGHKAILGKTRSGKSKFLERFFYRTRHMAFFVNPHRVPLRAHIVHTADDLKRALAAGHRRIQWQPPREHEVRGGKKAILGILGQMVAAIFGVGHRMMVGDKAPPWLLVIVDEAQLMATKTGNLGPVEMLLTEGAKFGVVVITATQRPARASHEMLGQAGQKFIFKLEPEDLEMLRSRKYPVDEFLAWLQTPYQFVMLDGEQWAPFVAIRL